MDSELTSFLAEYDGEDPNSISRFREYREKSAGINASFILILLVALVLHEGLSFRIAELPHLFSRYLLYILLVVPAISSLILRFGLRGVDMDHTRFSYHHIREVIQSYENSDYGGVIHHVNELHEDVDNSNNEAFSKKVDSAISDIDEELDESEMIESVIDDRFEKIAIDIVREVKVGESLDEITSSMKDSEQFEGSVMIDAAKNIGIQPSQIAPFAVVAVSAVVYFFVDKDAGYAIGMLLLSALGIANRS